MPPLPKNPKTRQRRNKTTTAATLRSEAKRAKTPALPPRVDDEGIEVPWHPLTISWWTDVWASPMADEYAQADIHRLFMLAVLIDEFWKKPSPAAHSEVRLAGAMFGLTPMDRRRLQWTIDAGDAAEDRRAKRAAARKTAAPAKKVSDPRGLHLVVGE